MKNEVNAVIHKVFDDLVDAIDEHARLLSVDGLRQLSPEFALVLTMTLAVRSQIERGARGALCPCRCARAARSATVRLAQCGRCKASRRWR